MQVHLPITSSVWGSIHRAFQGKQGALVPASQGTVSCFESKTPKPIVVLVAIVSALATPIFLLLDAIYLIATGCRSPKKNIQATTIQVQTTTPAGSASSRASVTFSKTVLLEDQTQPASTSVEVKKPIDPPFEKGLEVLNALEKKFGPIMDEEAKLLLARHRLYCKQVPKDELELYKSGIEHISYVSQELEMGKYSTPTALIVIKSLLRMTSLEPYSDKEVQYLSQLKYKPEEKGDLKTTKSQRGCIAVVRQNGQIVARVREDRADRFGNIKRSLASFAFDRAIGIKSVNTTIKRDGLLLQTWLFNGITLHDILSKDSKAAEKLQNLDLAETQLHLLSGVLRNNGDGHGNNVMLTPDEKGQLHLVDVDQEEDFSSVNFKPVKDNTNEDRANRFAALGLPQAGKPIPKVLLKLFCWKGLKEKTKAVLEKNDYHFDQTLEERWDKIQKIFQFESTQENPQVSARDLYFALHGKDYLFEKFLRSGWPSYSIFSFQVDNHDDCRAAQFSLKEIANEKNTPEENRTRYDNVLRLDPLTPPKFTMYSKGDQYPGDAILSNLKKNLIHKEMIRALKIEKGAFDEEGWKRYLKYCETNGNEPDLFMLSHFMQGLAKRVTRLIAFRYPFCEIKVVQENGDFWLEVKSSKSLVAFGEKWKKDKKGIHEVIEIDPKECSFKEFQDLKKSKDYDPVIKYHYVIAKLSGKSKKLAQYIDDRCWRDGKQLDLIEKNGRIILVYEATTN